MPAAHPEAGHMLAAHFAEIRALHIACVALSGSLFACRGLLRLGERSVANAAPLRWASYCIDSTLLAAAVLLMLIVHQYPFVDAWLTTKVLLLIVYIVLGVAALRLARTRRARALAFAAALLTFFAIVGVALTHRPCGWLCLVHI
jgi:uncharacterized membrane protein SirB2